MRNSQGSDSEKGQLLLGSALFLAIAAAASLALLSVATHRHSTQRTLATARMHALSERNETAARLNELAIGQSLALWHLAGALRAQQHFREAAFFTMALRPYWNTPALPIALPKDPGLAALRNALSRPSARHLVAFGTQLATNASLVAAIESREPGFRRALAFVSASQAACVVAAQWLPRKSFEVPALSRVADAFAAAHPRFEATECAYRVSPVFAPFSAGIVARPGHDVATFLSEFAPGALPGGFFLSRARGEAPFSPGAWTRLFNRDVHIPRVPVLIRVGVRHPHGSTPQALFEPRWIPALGALHEKSE